MARVCSVCGKGNMSGNMLSHSHRKTRRSWSANLQRIRVKSPSGKIERNYVCTRCIRGGKIERA